MDTAINRAGQKESLIIQQRQIDHVRHALKGLHITSYFPRPWPDGDHSSGKCAIDILYPPHADETNDGTTRKIKVLKGTLIIRPVNAPNDACWVWGESTGGHVLGHKPA
ncbi:MAG: hypothetical protein HY286_12005 [Planctomycetes bacterium]|nr:hypothetical protein [Planctomycetota bacterium]